MAGQVLDAKSELRQRAVRGLTVRNSAIVNARTVWRGTLFGANEESREVGHKGLPGVRLRGGMRLQIPAFPGASIAIALHSLARVRSDSQSVQTIPSPTTSTTATRTGTA